MLKQISALAAATFLLAACGDEPADPADAAAESGAGSEAGVTSTSGEPSAEVAAEDRGEPIPQAFHGAWGIMGDCGDPDSVVRVSDHNMVWPGQGDGAVINVRPISTTQVEMEEAPKPEFPDADLRFGLSISADGQGMTLSSPQSSSLPFTRCADAGASAAAPRSGASAGGGLPAAFHGRWIIIGAHGEYACDEGDPDLSTLSATSRRYGDGITRFTEIRRIDDRTYAMTAQYSGDDGETMPAVEIQYRLSAEGDTITETIEGYEPFEHARCNSVQGSP